MDYLINFFRKDIVRRVIVFIIVGLVLYLLKGMLNIFLLTFIFTYLLYSAQVFINHGLKKVVRVKHEILTVIIYVIVISLIALFLYAYIPVLVEESKAIFKQAREYYRNPYGNPIAEYIVAWLKELNLADYLERGVGFLWKSVFSVSRIGFDIFISLILSLFFQLEKSRIAHFTSRFKASKIAVFYNEIQYFGVKFLHSFGKVIQAQFVIALVNSVLSVIALALMGFQRLPFLGAMIFILGLVPVAGVFISLIPLSIMAFSIGGFPKVISVMIMIAALHALESYVLNPKLMSAKTNLPVFYTFMVLLISEYAMGIWGLIIGIPIFMFVIDLLGGDKSTE